ncbi:uncharacterized protein [Diadema setosum]|uniref:uncharacterized protein n=1 Tax=Diadema setosum TaxID=31175 RepID=UPI003B3A2E01
MAVTEYPLHAAAIEGSLDLVRHSLQAGAKVNVRDSDGWTALHHAAFNGRLEVLEFLLAVGAKPKEYVRSAGSNDDSQWEGAHPIHLASWNGHLEVIRFLISKGATIGAKSRFGISPLHCAAFSGYLDVFRYLLAKGAKINEPIDSKDIDEEWVGSRALHLAAWNGHLELVEYALSAGADVAAKARIGITALHCAVHNGHLDVVKCLLQNGARIDERIKGNNGALSEWNGAQPMHVAAHYGHVELVGFILDQGVHVMATDKQGCSALHHVTKGQLDVFKHCSSLVIEEDREAERRGSTPNHLLTSDNHLSVIECLVRQGADVNSQSHDGQTCLHLAVRQCGGKRMVNQMSPRLSSLASQYPEYRMGPDRAFVMYLMEEGARCTARDKQGKTALECTIHPDVRQMIASKSHVDVQEPRDSPDYIATSHEAPALNHGNTPESLNGDSTEDEARSGCLDCFAGCFGWRSDKEKYRGSEREPLLANG